MSSRNNGWGEAHSSYACNLFWGILGVTAFIINTFLALFVVRPLNPGLFAGSGVSLAISIRYLRAAVQQYHPGICCNSNSGGGDDDDGRENDKEDDRQVQQKSRDNPGQNASPSDHGAKNDIEAQADKGEKPELDATSVNDSTDSVSDPDPVFPVLNVSACTNAFAIKPSTIPNRSSDTTESVSDDRTEPWYPIESMKEWGTNIISKFSQSAPQTKEQESTKTRETFGLGAKLLSQSTTLTSNDDGTVSMTRKTIKEQDGKTSTVIQRRTFINSQDAQRNGCMVKDGSTVEFLNDGTVVVKSHKSDSQTGKMISVQTSYATTDIARTFGYSIPTSEQPHSQSSSSCVMDSSEFQTFQFCCT